MGKDIIIERNRVDGETIAVGDTVIDAIRKALEANHQSLICLPQEAAMKLLREFDDAKKPAC